MHINAGIDTGEVIHQIRARYSWGDTPSQIGNRLICEMASVCRIIITNFEKLEKMLQMHKLIGEKVYKDSDYVEESVATLYRNFKNGLVERYLCEEKTRCDMVPIIVNPAVKK